VLSAADRFYSQFCQVIAENLSLADGTAEAWAGGGGNNQLATRYVQNQVIKELNRPLVLAMDEVDRLFEADYRSDFFSMLRGWHNNHAAPLPLLRPWKLLDLALVTATEPYHLIANFNQSTLNVGEVIQLGGFNAEQVAELHQRHGVPLGAGPMALLMELFHGLRTWRGGRCISSLAASSRRRGCRPRPPAITDASAITSTNTCSGSSTTRRCAAACAR
jgi:hypothetical protein